MAEDLTLKHHRGTPSGVAEVLEKPITQEMLNRDIARLAYVAKDGTPRVVPIGFTWNGTEVVMCTTTNAPKLASLRRNPAVALTIDTEVHPPKILLLRGEQPGRRDERSRAAAVLPPVRWRSCGRGGTKARRRDAWVAALDGTGWGSRLPTAAPLPFAATA